MKNYLKTLTMTLVAYTSFVQASTTKTDQSEIAGLFGMTAKPMQPEPAPISKSEEERKKGGIFTAEVLYWSTNYNLPFAFDFSQSGSSLNSASPIVNFQTNKIDAKFFRPSPRWTTGGRVGFGGNTGFDGWEFIGYYTYYHNETEKHVSSDQQHINVAWGRGEAEYNLTYQVGDIEIGKIFYSSPKVTLRPLCGIRGAWIDQSNRATFKGDAVTFTDNTGATFFTDQPLKINLDLDVRAIGPRIGLNSNWGSYRGLSILANVSASLLYGKGHTKIKVKVDSASQDSGGNISDSTTDVNVRDHFWELFPNLQLMLGVTWGYAFNHGKNMFRMSASWESNFWWETANVLFFERSLSMQGLTAGLGIDF
ncbi:MAG: hypothetical protein JSR58_04130 [Verrucomicrobia bacterium]|nr:hypothetical protein [Verrucomicrobiota bacterium]